jgi:hypothetical protein
MKNEAPTEKVIKMVKVEEKSASLENTTSSLFSLTSCGEKKRGLKQQHASVIVLETTLVKRKVFPSAFIPIFTTCLGKNRRLWKT